MANMTLDESVRMIKSAFVGTFCKAASAAAPSDTNEEMWPTHATDYVDSVTLARDYTKIEKPLTKGKSETLHVRALQHGKAITES